MGFRHCKSVEEGSLINIWMAIHTWNYHEITIATIGRNSTANAPVEPEIHQAPIRARHHRCCCCFCCSSYLWPQSPELFALIPLTPPVPPQITLVFAVVDGASIREEPKQMELVDHGFGTDVLRTSALHWEGSALSSGICSEGLSLLYQDRDRILWDAHPLVEDQQSFKLEAHHQLMPQTKPACSILCVW